MAGVAEIGGTEKILGKEYLPELIQKKVMRITKRRSFYVENRVVIERVVDEGETTEVELNKGVNMDSSLWSRLPAELLECVVARLPFLALLRLRLVCKRWDSLVSTPSFLQDYLRFPSREEPWLLSGTVRDNKLAFYVPSLRKWHIATLPLIDMANFDDTVVPEATMGGLICFTKHVRQDDWTMVTSQLFVWDPIANDGRQLPSSLRKYAWPGLCVAGIYVDLESRSYKVVTVGNQGVQADAGHVAVTEIYDSTVGTWKIGRGAFPQTTVSRLTRWNVCSKGTIFSVMRKPYSIVAFDVKEESWREIAVPLTEEGIECPNLVELQGTLYMVAGILKTASLRIWRLLLRTAKASDQWVEVDTMPKELLTLMSTSKNPIIRHWRCVGSGDSLYFRGWGSVEVLMYSMSKRTWSWLPTCSLDNKRHYYAWNGLCFNPRLGVR